MLRNLAHSPIGRSVIQFEYFSEFEVIFEAALGYESGAQAEIEGGGGIMRKAQGKKLNLLFLYKIMT
jgi:hypothetical protein